jgi:hypothetical protein
MAEKKEPKQGWADRRREKKRLQRERTGPSPEKEATHHTVKLSATDSFIDAGTAVPRGGRTKR